MQRSGSRRTKYSVQALVSAMTLVLTVAKPSATAAPPPSPLRDAWKIVTIFYPDVAAESEALVSFQTHQIAVTSISRSTEDGGWSFGGPFLLRVRRPAASSTGKAPMLEADITSAPSGQLRSFSLGQCELYDASALNALSRELTDNHAGPEDIDRRLLARFAAYPPSRWREADKAFREKFNAARAVLGEISISDVHFGASYTRDPSDQSVELHWLVTGSRGNDRVVALFEPFQGRLVSLEIL